MIIRTERETYCMQKHLALFLPENCPKKIKEKIEYPDILIKNNLEITKKGKSIAQIEQYLSNMGVLTFGVTQECNLRCRYCAYGGYYNEKRKHRNLKMHISVYKKSIDIFLDHIYSKFRTNRGPITLSFYGGEPLLCLEDILEATQYAIEKNFNRGNLFQINFLLNTNGVLLTPEVVKKLEEFNFKIDISLDGPKGEHDKFRIKKNGSGSFVDVLLNIQKIKEKNTNYYDQMIRIFVTIHPYHNIEEIESFFYQYKEFFSNENVLIHWIDMNNLKTIVRQDWLEAKALQKEQLANTLDKGNWFYYKIVTSYFNSFKNIPTPNLAKKTRFTANCLPGETKIFVDTNGDFHICERIAPDFQIGNVSTGLNLEKIRKIITMWDSEILSNECWKCNAWWICKKCYENSTALKKIEIKNTYCKNSIKITEEYCDLLLNLLEDEDEKNHFNNCTNVIDYIESL